jgi:hypothetical protein
VLHEGKHPAGHELCTPNRRPAAGYLGDRDHASASRNLNAPAGARRLNLIGAHVTAGVDDDLHAVTLHVRVTPGKLRIVPRDRYLRSTGSPDPPLHAASPHRLHYRPQSGPAACKAVVVKLAGAPMTLTSHAAFNSTRPAERPTAAPGAGDENRTRMTSLEGWGSAIELHPRVCPS